MPDPTRPWPDTEAVERIVDALTAPASDDELADEARYVRAFVAASHGLPAGAAPLEKAGRRRRRSSSRRCS